MHDGYVSCVARRERDLQAAKWTEAHICQDPERMFKAGVFARCGDAQHAIAQAASSVCAQRAAADVAARAGEWGRVGVAAALTLVDEQSLLGIIKLALIAAATAFAYGVHGWWGDRRIYAKEYAMHRFSDVARHRLEYDVPLSIEQLQPGTPPDSEPAWCNATIID